MSLHTKTLTTLAALACLAVTAMVTIAVEPGVTPTLAVKLAPVTFFALIPAALISYALDLIQSMRA